MAHSASHGKIVPKAYSTISVLVCTLLTISTPAQPPWATGLIPIHVDTLLAQIERKHPGRFYLEICREYDLGLVIPERNLPPLVHGPIIPPCELVDCNPGAPGPMVDELIIEFDPRHFATLDLEAIGSSTRYFAKAEHGKGRIIYRNKNLFAGVDQVRITARPVLKGVLPLRAPLDTRMVVTYRSGQGTRKSRGIQMALVPCGLLGTERIPIAIQELALGQDIVWPMMASIPLPQGKIPQGQLGRWTLEENGDWIAAQLDSVSVWPDGSYKWIHVHFNANYNAACGRWERYELVRKLRHAGTMRTLENGPLTTTLTESSQTGKTNVSIVNAALEFKVLNDEISVTDNHSSNTYKCIASMVAHAPGDLAGKALSSTRLDSVVVEQQGPLQCIVRVSGRYTVENTSHHRFITRYYISTLGTMKVEHATIFTENMGAMTDEVTKNSRAQDIGFHLIRLNAQGRFTTCNSGLESGSTFLEPITPDRPFSFHQISDTTYRLNSSTTRRRGRSGGWIHVSSNLNDGNVLLLAKDLWQKYPKEVTISDDSLSFYSWPKNGVDDFATLDEINDSSLYKFLCFHSGDMLDLMIPDEYILHYNESSSGINGQPMCDEEHEADGEAIEMRVKWVNGSILPDRGPDQGDAIGVAIFNEFSFCFGRPAQVAPASVQLVQHEPIAMPTQEHTCATMVFGNVAPRVKGQYDDIEETILLSPMAFSDPTVTRNYGMWNYGDQNESWIPALDRPAYHRVWFNNHYQFMHSMWQTYAVRFDASRTVMNDFLSRARTVTDHYSSVDFAWDSIPNGKVPPQKRGPGGFRHTRGPTHWGNKEGIDINAHASDPAGLRLAWVIGGDRWAKEAFTLWVEQLKNVSGIRQKGSMNGLENRHHSQNLFNAIDLLNWDLRVSEKAFHTQIRNNEWVVKDHVNSITQLDTWRGYLLSPHQSDHCFDSSNPCCRGNLVAGLDSFGTDCSTSALYNPLWPIYFAQLEGTPSGRPWLDRIGQLWDKDSIGIYHKNASPALAALLATVKNRPDLLTQFYYLFSKYPLNVYRNPGHKNHAFGVGPGDLGDMHYPLQWPYYLSAIRHFNVRIPSMDWRGQYPYGTTNVLIVDTVSQRDSLDLELFSYKDNNPDPTSHTPLIGSLYAGCYPFMSFTPSTLKNEFIADSIHKCTAVCSMGFRSLSTSSSINPVTFERSRSDVVRIPVRCSVFDQGTTGQQPCYIRVINLTVAGVSQHPYNSLGLPETMLIKSGNTSWSLHSSSSFMQPISADTVHLIIRYDTNIGHNAPPVTIRIFDRFNRERLNKSHLGGAEPLGFNTDTIALDQHSAPFSLYIYSAYSWASSNALVKVAALNGGILVGRTEKDLCEVVKRLVSDSPYGTGPCD
jgi:hypothetical protein